MLIVASFLSRWIITFWLYLFCFDLSFVDGFYMYGFGCTLFETEDVLEVFGWHKTEFVWCSMMCNFRFHQLHRLSEEHCGCCTRCWKLRCLWCRVPNWGMFCMGRLDSTAASGCKNWLMADLGLADCEAIRLKMILISHKRNDMKIHEPPRTNGIHLDKWLSQRWAQPARPWVHQPVRAAAWEPTGHAVLFGPALLRKAWRKWDAWEFPAKTKMFAGMIQSLMASRSNGMAPQNRYITVYY